MNNEAKTLGLKRSHFASAHGMYVEANISAACDIARLCFFIMKNHTFRDIVNQ
jgi:D-alanyl-D-alanine carboxypeptidase